MKEELIAKTYEIIKERYTTLGVDVEKMMEQLQRVAISIHCWQAGDVIGFEPGGSLTGGTQTTGSYPGKARNMREPRNGILKTTSYIPGKCRLNLHEIYGGFDSTSVDRDQVGVKYFESWMQQVAEDGMKLDFNSTSSSHPKSGNLSLSNPDRGIRGFWIGHTKRYRAIAEEMGRRQGDSRIMNLWVHDGSKGATVNRARYHKLFKGSLDRVFATKYKNMEDCLGSKVFSIGLEGCTVGSNEFCAGYSVQHQKLTAIDTGHFHPAESAADKVSSMLSFVPELILHVSRSIRWDSDHTTVMDDPTLELSQEIVRCNALDRVHIGLDYFGTSINRIGACIIGTRAAQKCVLRALLEPLAKLREYGTAGQGFQHLALLEGAKALPWNAVWDMFCLKNNVPMGEESIPEIEKYEVEITSRRN